MSRAVTTQGRQSDTQTIRQPSASALLIDSMDRYADGYPSGPNNLISSSQWRLQSQGNVLNGYFTRLCLSQIQFFWTLPTVIAGYNDQVNFTTYSATTPFPPLASYVATIPPGFYSVLSLLYATTTAMNTIVGTTVFTVPTTVDTGTGSYPLGNMVLIGNKAFTIDVPSVPASRAGRFYQTSGLIPSANPDAATSTQVGGVPTLLPTRFIDITSSYLTKYQRVKDASSLSTGSTQNILGRVYAFAGNTSTPWPPSTQTPATSAPFIPTYTWTTPEPFVVNQDLATAKWLNWSPDEYGISGNFDITLLDEYGTLVPWDVSYGSEYQFTLLCSES